VFDDGGADSRRGIGGLSDTFSGLFSSGISSGLSGIGSQRADFSSLNSEPNDKPSITFPSFESPSLLGNFGSLDGLRVGPIRSNFLGGLVTGTSGTTEGASDDVGEYRASTSGEGQGSLSGLMDSSIAPTPHASTDGSALAGLSWNQSRSVGNTSSLIGVSLSSDDVGHSRGAPGGGGSAGANITPEIPVSSDLRPTAAPFTIRPHASSTPVEDASMGASGSLLSSFGGLNLGSDDSARGRINDGLYSYLRSTEPRPSQFGSGTLPSLPSAFGQRAPPQPVSLQPSSTSDAPPGLGPPGLFSKRSTDSDD